MDRVQLINYFMDEFTEGQFTTKEQYLKRIESRTTEELKTIYNRQIARKENEKQIYNEGTKAYKIEYSQEIRKEIFTFMRNNNMFIYDNSDKEFTSYLLEFGEIMYYVPEVFVNELEKHFEVKRLNSIHILGKNELSNFKVGDKVKIIFNNWYGGSTEQGTVCAIEGDEIIVRKYRSRNQGFTFKAGEECNMITIDKFEKAV